MRVSEINISMHYGVPFAYRAHRSKIHLNTK